MYKESLKKWLTEQISYLKKTKEQPEKFAWDPEYDLQLAAFRLALERLEPVGPLTLEQLREMGGQPYWHVGLQDDSPEPHWKILDLFVAKHPEDYGYGKRWLAYAYHPAHINMEAWSGCVCTASDKSCCTCVSLRCQFCIGESEYKQGRYCSACGRPLTEEARAELDKRLRGRVGGEASAPGRLPPGDWRGRHG